MNILYIDHYAGSPTLGMEYRPFYLAREWLRSGHRVLIVAATFAHVRTRQPGASGAAADGAVDGVEYRWIAAPAYAGNGFGRARNIALFLWRLWRESAALVEAFHPDAVIASSTYPMDIWVARRIARIAGARLVHEVHDLWPASLIEVSGMSRWHPFALLCQKAENDAYRDADVVVSMLPKVVGHMQAHGLDLRKLQIVPNGIAPEEWDSEPAALDPALLAHLVAEKAAGRTVVGYAGAHGLANALDALLDAAALLGNENFSFVLVGEGDDKVRLARRLRDEGLGQVALFAPIAKAQIPAFLREIDIAYIGWQRVPIYRFGIAPNKLMDYMMSGCAVLHSVEAGNDPVAEAGCGVSVAAESAPAIAAGLRSLAALTPEARRAMGAKGRAYVLAHHTYPVLARRFADAMAATRPA